MAEVGRMPHQGLTREQLIELINCRKKEFDEVLDKYDSLKIEISKLEEELHGMGESLNNPRSCMNQGVFAQRKCDQCG